jgi:hypothetical protein
MHTAFHTVKFTLQTGVRTCRLSLVGSSRSLMRSQYVSTTDSRTYMQK